MYFALEDQAKRLGLPLPNDLRSCCIFPGQFRPRENLSRFWQSRFNNTQKCANGYVGFKKKESCGVWTTDIGGLALPWHRLHITVTTHDSNMIQCLGATTALVMSLMGLMGLMGSMGLMEIQYRHLQYPRYPPRLLAPLNAFLATRVNRAEKTCGLSTFVPAALFSCPPFPRTRCDRAR